MSVEICDVVHDNLEMYFPYQLSFGWRALTYPPICRMMGCPSVDVPWSHFVQARRVKVPGTDDVVRSVPLPYPVRLFGDELKLGRLLAPGEVSEDRDDCGGCGVYTGLMTLTLSDPGNLWEPVFVEIDSKGNQVTDPVMGSVQGGTIQSNMGSKPGSTYARFSLRAPSCSKSHPCRIQLRLEGLVPLPQSMWPSNRMSCAWALQERVKPSWYPSLHRSELQDLQKVKNSPKTSSKLTPKTVSVAEQSGNDPCLSDESWLGRAVAEFRAVFLSN